MFPENKKKYEEFKTAFEEYYNALSNYAHTFLNDKNLCEDIVQEVFVRIWEKRQNLIGSPSLRFYLFTAVRNNCLSQIQETRKKLFIQSENIEKELAKLPDERHEDDVTYLPLIRKAMSLLPPKCKDIFLLSRISNLSYKEIAAMLGISIKTVENQIGKALKILRNFIKENKPFMLLCIIACVRSINNGLVGDFIKKLFF